MAIIKPRIRAIRVVNVNLDEKGQIVFEENLDEENGQNVNEEN
jgi:hypothetical protein